MDDNLSDCRTQTTVAYATLTSCCHAGLRNTCVLLGQGAITDGRMISASDPDENRILTWMDIVSLGAFNIIDSSYLQNDTSQQNETFEHFNITKEKIHKYSI